VYVPDVVPLTVTDTAETDSFDLLLETFPEIIVCCAETAAAQIVKMHSIRVNLIFLILQYCLIV
ncbi:MAG TPA: hypothetical protein PKZ66_04705, partial [Chitinophagaceae bacterium]|nr:hypothetical protein [Chitinophagaceae bacterium]